MAEQKPREPRSSHAGAAYLPWSRRPCIDAASSRGGNQGLPPRVACAATRVVSRSLAAPRHAPGVCCMPRSVNAPVMIGSADAVLGRTCSLAFAPAFCAVGRLRIRFKLVCSLNAAQCLDWNTIPSSHLATAPGSLRCQRKKERWTGIPRLGGVQAARVGCKEPSVGALGWEACPCTINFPHSAGDTSDTRQGTCLSSAGHECFSCARQRLHAGPSVITWLFTCSREGVETW